MRFLRQLFTQGSNAASSLHQDSTRFHKHTLTHTSIPPPLFLFHFTLSPSSSHPFVVFFLFLLLIILFSSFSFLVNTLLSSSPPVSLYFLLYFSFPSSLNLKTSRITSSAGRHAASTTPQRHPSSPF